MEDNITGNKSSSLSELLELTRTTSSSLLVQEVIITSSLRVRSTGNNHNFNTFIPIKPVKTVMHYTKASPRFLFDSDSESMKESATSTLSMFDSKQAV